MKTKVWIYCRVSESEKKALLDFQETILTNFAEKMGFQVVGITKEVSDGKRLSSFKSQAMLNYIHRKRIDMVMAVTIKRICIFEDIFEEFEMLCNMNNVSVMPVNEITKLERMLDILL